MALVKGSCVSCGKNYYIDEVHIPVDAEPGDAIPSKCPLCNEDSYLILVKPKTE